MIEKSLIIWIFKWEKKKNKCLCLQLLDQRDRFFSIQKKSPTRMVKNKVLPANSSEYQAQSMRKRRCIRQESRRTAAGNRKNDDEPKKSIDELQQKRIHEHTVYPSKKQSGLHPSKFSRKHLLIISAICFPGLLTIIGLVVPNIVLYLMLPILCKFFKRRMTIQIDPTP